ncbi:MAG: flagellin FliC, partial [Myxococcota bacterium]
MSLTINTNVASLKAQSNLNKSQGALGKSFERLSSGFRINSAADDAAGLAVSESLNSRVRSYAVAERNTNNGISMANTAEGGLNEISGVVVRMRELAVQAANGDLTSTDRGFLDTEFQALSSEIDRLAETTEFNGRELLAGTTSTISFQVGIGT